VIDDVGRRRFREIVPPLLDDAFTLAKWLTRSATDAEDVVQEAAVRALNALATVSVDRPRPWFLAIVRNAAMTWMARNRPKALAYAGDLTDLEAIDASDVAERPLDPEQALIALEEGDRLRQAIADLPSPLLETLVMRDINGLSYREIAEATDSPVGTVMSRLARARSAIAKAMKTNP
jgi:RNA polymerase sigma factor (sigma-70 family)